MAGRAQQHFVPQYYFRNFNNGGTSVHLLLKKTGEIRLNASVRGQCARHKFYGSAEAEEFLSTLDALHSATIREFRTAAWAPGAPMNATQFAARLGFAKIVDLLRACLFQRARTALEAAKMDDALEASTLALMRDRLLHEHQYPNRDKLLRAIDDGAVRVRHSPRAMAWHHIKTAFESTELLSDLGFHLLRNNTDLPFIFGDSPVVFYNSYLRRVTHRGVLGYQSPGLQIFWPLDSRTLLMLIDMQVYRGWYQQSPVVDLVERGDVSQLNVLQLHHSDNAIYFGDARHASYIAELWRTHANSVVVPKTTFRQLTDALVDGEPGGGDIMHFVEPQIAAHLSLSFVSCDVLDPDKYVYSYRSPDLVESHKKRFPDDQVADHAPQSDV